ncbi:MAG: ester cyclase [Pseudomonadota bacterium]
MTDLKHHYDSAPPAESQQSTMQGFDSEFADLVDYILRITYRIWEGKQIGLIYDYYSEDCPVYTLAGLSRGAETVVQNTLNTLAAFPDRTLHAENVIWSGDDQDEYFSSHRIRTHMTNLGPSEFGPATGKHAVIQVIAHCVVKNNQVIREWLVRDNYSLAVQLGFEPHEVAKNWAQTPLNSEFETWRQQEIERISQQITTARQPFTGNAEESPEAFIHATLQNIWNARMVGDVCYAYAENATLNASGERSLNGHQEIIRFYMQFLGTLSNLRVAVDHVCCQPCGDHGVDIAVRWTLAGQHTGLSLYGPPTGAPILILGESHYRIVDGVIEEEWTIFDELSVLTQIYRARAATGLKSDNPE